MKAVPSHSIAAIELIRQRIQEGMVRQGLMKCCVKHGDLWQAFAKQCPRGSDAFDVRRIVQWRQVDAVFEAANDFVVYQHRSGETFAAMHDAMADRLNIGDASD